MNHKVTSINKITFRDDGSPYSEQFNDIYFDTESGYQQSEHVFIKGNNIAENLINCPQEYTIAETGFGTGLNFLLTCVIASFFSSLRMALSRLSITA